MRALGLCAISIALLAFTGSKTQADGAPSTGDKAPDFVIEALDGETISLSGALAEADAVILFFFTPWCESYVQDSYPQMARECGEARRNIVELHETLGDKLHCIGISSRYSARAESVEFYRNKYAIKFPLAFDATDAIFRDFNVRHFPTIIIVNRDGLIDRRIEGPHVDPTAFE